MAPAARVLLLALAGARAQSWSPGDIISDWEDAPTCPFDCLFLTSNGAQLSQIGNCGCECTDGIEPSKNGYTFPELYIVKHGYYAHCAFHSDPKLLCGCARECTNLNVNEDELTAGGVCPPYQGDVYEQTCDAVYTGPLTTDAHLSVRAAFEALDGVIGSTEGGALLDEATTVTVTDAAATVKLYKREIILKRELILQALDLIDTYEASPHGPLFLKPSHPGYFMRLSSDHGDYDYWVIDRAIMSVAQILMDYVYQPGALAACSRGDFEGRGWLTSSYYPGAALPPADPSVVHTVSIDASLPPDWGVPVAFASEPARRPTGLYLAPGEIASITVPAEMVKPEAPVGEQFNVLVGGNTADNTIKDRHRRMDRVTVTYRIKETTFLVTNPLGGGIYINTPLGADLGVVQIAISGGVIKAPHFRRTSWDMQTDADWALSRTNPGPWADFETDKFMIHLPRDWVYALDKATEMLQHYDLAMDGASEWIGIPPERRHRHVLFIAPDLHIRASAYGVGYPQINVEYFPNEDYGGYANHWMVRDPTGSYVTWHELGHACFTSKYYGEEEALVNYMLTYILHVKYGVPFNEAFFRSRAGNEYLPDQAAVHWMITPNFRDGNEMDHSATPYDEFRYQARGYGKYADITRLWGWEAFTRFYYDESVHYAATGDRDQNDGLADEDSRTLRWSLEVGEDLTPFIEFWGIFPQNPTSLSAKMEENGLTPGIKVRCLLTRYRELIPADNAAFLAFYTDIYGEIVDPGDEDPRYGRAWYWAWKDLYQQAEGTAAKARVDTILTKWWPGSESDSCEGVHTGEDGEIHLGRPTSYTWLDSISRVEDLGCPLAPLTCELTEAQKSLKCSCRFKWSEGCDNPTATVLSCD